MSDLFFLIVVVCFLVSFFQSFFVKGRSSQRRIYWSCTVLAATAGFLAAYPDWSRGVGFALFVVFVMTVIAYAYTPYIKLDGKIYAMTVQDSRPDEKDRLAPASVEREQDPAPDSYSGVLTASKMWWIVVGLMVMSGVNFYAFVNGEMEWWVAAIGLAFLIFLSVTTGYGDASWGYGIARGQHVQFGIAGVVTAGVFTVLYLLAYHTGKRLPLRRTQSMEYRAHPRHRREFDES